MNDQKPTGPSPLPQVLSQVALQLKGSLGNIHSALERLAPPEKRETGSQLDLDAAALCQSYYRIMRLANNLSDAAELEGPCRARLQNLDIVAFCRSVMEKAEQPAELLGLNLAFRCGQESRVIAMDPDRLERLMMNLLSNAFKFTPRGGSVTLEVKVTGQWVQLILTDTGAGIPADRLETVFDRYRSAQTADPPPHGLGLGLPICRRIAQEHGGAILLTSREGQGTTVTVSLPNRKNLEHTLNTVVFDYAGGFNRTLLELSDALPRRAFIQAYLD